MNKSMIAVALGAAGLAAAGGYFYLQQQPDSSASHVAGAAAPAAAGASAANKGGGAARPPGGGGPISVTTVKAQQRDQRITLEATGTVSSLNVVDIKPQVSSKVEQVHVKEGQFVRRGELLFTLDNRADAVNVTKMRAQLARDQAALNDAQRQLARSRDLLEQKFVSQSAVDAAQTQVETQQAVVAASKAAVDAAVLGLGYHRITAPSAGRVGAVNVFPGSLVQPSGPALLTITQLDPIAVSFNLPQRNLDETLQGLREGGLPVSAQLPDRSDGTPGPRLDGKLQFVDSVVDQSSGSVRVKAVFDNPQQHLWPGGYVKVALAVRTLRDAIVIPQAAIVTGVKGRTVFVVDADDKVQPRPVEIVHPVGQDAVVSGLQAGDRIVVDGRENVRAGSKVVERGGQGGAGKPGRAGTPASGAAGVTP
ncbi:efflux RND transporter periplasmic adaptor subunit [Piscinibacter sakaiensis]|uniref:efflux RND transporter periplasmic adaptor subunit n=1 Tax=Piscinibacter sakaiensis TaxID=1547922 RepID=UPI003AACD0F1